jgi:hypothetical protein
MYLFVPQSQCFKISNTEKCCHCQAYAHFSIDDKPVSQSESDVILRW